MVSKRLQRIETAHKQLIDALKAYDQASDNQKELAFLTVAKAFEVLIEYAWKELKLKVSDEGLEAQSPKEAVRQAARIGLIKDPDLWIACINARNLSVHDYFSIGNKDYVDLANSFARVISEIEK